MSDLDEVHQNSFVGDETEASSEDFGDIVAEYVGHQDIGVFAIREIHRAAQITNNVQVRFEQLESSVKDVNLKEFFLFTRSLPKQKLIDEFEVGVLHHVDHPAQLEPDVAPLLLAARLNNRPVTWFLSKWYLARTISRAQLQSRRYSMRLCSFTFGDSRKISLNTCFTIS